MMQKWSRKKTTNFPVLVLLFCVFIVASLLYSELSIHQIHEDKAQKQASIITHTSQTETQPSHIQTLPSSTNISINRNPNPNPLQGDVDRFTTCSSTISYNGRRTRRFISTLKPHHVHSNGGSSDSCDVFSGKWVFDNTSYPLYEESECRYMSDQLACSKHGRSDLMYQSWRWQPKNCNIKRWNVTEMWEKLRNKRLMFVGDSLNRGQWISMVCLLQSVVPVDKQSMSPNAPLTIFKAEEYNATVEFYWAPLLVESNSDDPVNHRLDDRIIRPDSVLKHAAQWEKADILVFNTYLWWRQGPIKLLWSNEEHGVCEELDGTGAMKLAMEAWADWVASKVDPRLKRVFFVTMSPTHLWSREWEPETEGNCYQETRPIDMEGYWGSGSDLATMAMVDAILSRLSSKVGILNITQLSEYRKDGHPSIYRKFWENLSEEQLSNPSGYSDCIHWCLPGVPDVWNELLFHFL